MCCVWCRVLPSSQARACVSSAGDWCAWVVSVISMVWVQVLWLLIVAGNLWPVLGQTVPTSPCPSMFWYERDASGNWGGRLNIPAPPAGGFLRTVVELDIDAVLNTVSLNYLYLYEACISSSIYLKKISFLHYVGRDNSVSTATRYGLDGPGIESRWGDFPQPFRPSLKPTQPPIQWVPGLFRG